MESAIMGFVAEVENHLATRVDDSADTLLCLEFQDGVASLAFNSAKVNEDRIDLVYQSAKLNPYIVRYATVKFQDTIEITVGDNPDSRYLLDYNLSLLGTENSETGNHDVEH